MQKQNSNNGVFIKMPEKPNKGLYPDGLDFGLMHEDTDADDFMPLKKSFRDLSDLDQKLFISKVIELCQKSPEYYDSIKYLLEEGAHHLTDKHFNEAVK